jgi:hypothetical protein
LRAEELRGLLLLGRSLLCDFGQLKLKIWSDVLNLNLHSGSLLTVGLESPLDQLPDDQHPVAFVKRAARVLGDRAPCRAAVDVPNDVGLFELRRRSARAFCL